MTKRLIASFFFIPAVIGFALSLVVHLTTLLGIALEFSGVFGLHLGVFVVWLPTVIFAKEVNEGKSSSDFWKYALQNCPPWMRWGTYLIFGYALINFVFVVIVPATNGSEISDPSGLRAFSGHWMAFYATASAVLFSYARRNSKKGRGIEKGEATLD